VIELDLDVSNTREGRCRRDQTGNGGSGNDSGLIQDEVIGCFRFYLPVPGRRDSAPSLPSGLPVLTTNLFSCAEAIPQKKTAANTNSDPNNL